MKIKTYPPFLIGFVQALLVTLYCIIISTTMNYLGQLEFLKGNEITTGIVFLLLFIISALITGSLVFGYSILLYLQDKKLRRPLQIFGSTVASFIIILVVILFKSMLLL